MTDITALRAALADRYRIDRELGADGMATVYLAQDLKHQRNVAVKVLHPDLAAALGPDRFLAEIKTTANLQHPHILPLHDSGEALGFLFYVMPFVDGESLRDRLVREKQLPVDDAVSITREVANALDYAHGHAVIHRDIKPENILLHGGHALVADFGIALAVQSAGGHRMTQTGLSLGTPQYMSPEQAMGERAIDARSDIYALGVVLYELLTGDPPFTGSTVQAIVAKVMTEKPTAPSAIRDTVTPAVERAVLKSLAKLPADRWPTAAAFAAALVAPASEPIVRATIPEPRPSRVGRAASLAQTAATLGALGLAGWLLTHRGTKPDVDPVRFAIGAGPGEHFNALSSQPIAIAPDGRTIAWIGEGSGRPLFIRSLGDLAPRAVPGTSEVSVPFFSPDGKWIAYFATNGSVLNSARLFKVPVDGGPVVLVAERVLGLGGTWAPDGRIILGMQGGVGTGLTGGLHAVLANGGNVTPITAPLDSVDTQHRWPKILADGKTVLFTSWSARPSSARIGITSLATGKTKLLGITGAIPITVAAGHLLYVLASGALMAVPFDLGSWETTGEAVPVLDHVSVDDQGGLRVAVSASGTLVYAVGADDWRLVLVDTHGTATPLLDKPGSYGNPRFSPDGRRIALDLSVPATDIWLFDRRAGTLDRVTTSGNNDRPEWMPDGNQVFFRTAGTGMAVLLRQAVDGGGTADTLFAFRAPIHEGTLTPDGRTLVFRTSLQTGGNRDIWSVKLGSGAEPVPLLTTRFDELQPQLSPDGRWLAYVSDESSVHEVYVRPFPGPGVRLRVSIDGGTEPRWTREGDRIFYRSDRRMMAAGVRTSPELMVTDRVQLFEGNYVATAPHTNYDVAPGGKELVMIAPNEGRQDLIVVVNWIASIRARLRP